MRKLLALIVPAILLLTATTAYADTMRSRIRSVDMEAQTFTLKNGMTFRVNENVAVEELVPGKSVKVSYRTDSRGRHSVRKIIVRQ